ncbi:hypothetical protein [Nocardia brasiliensis]|uniref:Uncharacterized protein n=1 Tax=Nocardia brasiliensis (strain ATCC 700358 / HUJEG-1) TaxID=1133849 RepID=K0F4Y3_NOCB7|nr:hypothetical protein [Nocardia brasiliensis]AFU04679.1 hypothetical protein O3I_033650 [Nocardia brasiliensis ATCC 700358]OCF88341.1 hypothetical protein AW168_21890 [Nocardia brasiliensis]
MITANTAVTATVRMLALALTGVLIELAGPRAVLLGLAVLALPFIVLLCSTARPPEPAQVTSEST